jgi:carbonic anhydrase
MRTSVLELLGLLVAFIFQPCLASAATTAPVTADDALKMLQDGNARYVAGKSLHLREDQARRTETATGGQHPFVSILGCADSREPLEVVFDQGIGDIFNVRVAGNVADIDEIGTLEYGAGHVGTPLIVVLGHTKCGAVTAVVKKDHVTENIAKLVDNITPAVLKAQMANPGAEVNALINESITANVWQAIEDMIKGSPEIYELVETGKVKIVGAVYDIESGNVTWLGSHPELIKIMVAVKLEEEKAKKPVARAAPREEVKKDEGARVEHKSNGTEKSLSLKGRTVYNHGKHE